jgi:SAM-dependent methyltransferase
VDDDRTPGVGARIDWARYEGLTYDSFRERAVDPALSDSEKIGFPRPLRDGAEARILATIEAHLELDRGPGLSVIDIGCGCGVLARHLIELCEERGHQLTLVDSPEMLGQLPESGARRIPGQFPEPKGSFEALAGRVDAVLVYSVLQYVFEAQSLFGFVDAALELLAPGGSLLLGDVPNISKRKRFFASERGAAFHREFMGSRDDPEVAFNVIEPGKLDDSVILALLGRARSQGFDAYVLPQPQDLPLATRREDLLARRP